MARFYCPSLAGCELSSEESHHAYTVLRLREGASISVFDGKGSEAKAAITSATKNRVSFKTIAVQKAVPRPYSLILGQAVPKGKAMDMIVQKGTELGIHTLAPILSDRTVVQIDDEKPDSKQQKWTHTCLEACKQCGQNFLPLVEPARKLSGFLEHYRSSGALKLIASLQPDSRPLREALQTARQASGTIREIIYLIGPEGDFTPSEMGAARSAGYLPVSLGPNVLRTETAAIFLTSALLYEMQG